MFDWVLNTHLSGERDRYGQVAEHLIFHEGGSYHIEASPLICRANQWTGFYMLETFVMEHLNQLLIMCK